MKLTPHSQRLRRALLKRAQRRTANEQVALTTNAVNSDALDALGVERGTAHDGRLLMSRGDWTRAIAAGAVEVDMDALVKAR